MKTEEILLLISCILAIIIIILTFFNCSKEKFTTKKPELNSYELNLIKMIKTNKSTDEELKQYITDNASEFTTESFEKLKAYVKETFQNKKTKKN
jgi:hypothetical protein